MKNRDLREFTAGMALYKLTIAYDGTDFSGFQRQINKRTIQGELEQALRKIGWRGKSILYSGRTDSGVHAEGQVIACALDWGHRPIDLVKALNTLLPKDISVIGAQIVPDGFHPRYDAVERRYRYQIAVMPERNPLIERYFWRVWPEPDKELLESGAKVIVGRHDFSGFGRTNKGGATTMRTITEANWRFEGLDEAYFTIASKAFLYHMVRRIVFLLVRIGQNKLDAIEFERSFQKQGKLPAGIAPAQGLFLEQIYY